MSATIRTVGAGWRGIGNAFVHGSVETPVEEMSVGSDDMLHQNQPRALRSRTGLLHSRPDLGSIRQQCLRHRHRRPHRRRPMQTPLLSRRWYRLQIGGFRLQRPALLCLLLLRKQGLVLQQRVLVRPWTTWRRRRRRRRRCHRRIRHLFVVTSGSGSLSLVGGAIGGGAIINCGILRSLSRMRAMMSFLASGLVICV